MNAEELRELARAKNKADFEAAVSHYIRNIETNVPINARAGQYTYLVNIHSDEVRNAVVKHVKENMKLNCRTGGVTLIVDWSPEPEVKVTGSTHFQNVLSFWWELWA